jgi:hypothetical protein
MEINKEKIDELRKSNGLGIDSVYWEFQNKDDEEKNFEVKSMDYNTKHFRQVPFYKPISKLFDFNNTNEQ